MHRTVERSIALWKKQNGPIRENIGRHIEKTFTPWTPDTVMPKHPFYVDYTVRSCEWT